MTDLYSHGIKVPVRVKSDVDINISYDDIMNSDALDDIIAITPDEEK